MQTWLSVVGIGEDGIAGLSQIARSLLDQAVVVVGGDRHLAMLPKNDPRERLAWASPLEGTIAQILHRRGQNVCVLASGDPMCHGVGVTLTRHIPLTEMKIIPAPSAFSLACARLGWPLADIETFSLTHRPVSTIVPALAPDARLIILSANRNTPAHVANLLTQRGFGRSQITILEHMGGLQERQTECTANAWGIQNLSDLNTLAIVCHADPATVLLSRTAGLPDDAYHHDGQLTKREVRSLTLSTLAPLPGELLWDVGAGCGSIAIEWSRTHVRCRAIAIERHPIRLQHIADNALALGVPQLKIVAGEAPAALQDLPQPDAIFIGGGVTIDRLLEVCWTALRPGGRLVVNAVTIESEQIVLQSQQLYGGDLVRIGIQRVAPIGSFSGWKPLIPVTQWKAIKPLIP